MVYLKMLSRPKTMQHHIKVLLFLMISMIILTFENITLHSIQDV